MFIIFPWACIEALLLRAGSIAYNFKNNSVMLHQVSTCVLEDEWQPFAQFKRGVALPSPSRISKDNPFKMKRVVFY